ncbi:hypothetical protein BOQ62_09895 [Chryseobacterium sp. CH21]|uniref:hypothetical protein n=1 Tax=Chryseobacterium sp. CH21 TaxID=713556 RepID=UPI00100AA940|nr:hypothetical protein [Chryseobacterium sp. CH21]RXM39729.1 hypothetical protein BOQ62_09895 [Chryseobacterium sp. CH21]
MKKKICLIGMIIIKTSLFSQVGINTSNPLGTFHVDGSKDNPSSGDPSISQASNGLIAASAGNLELGTITPTRKWTRCKTWGLCKKFDDLKRKNVLSFPSLSCIL